jgi:SAM-dependent methyltransferase
VSGAAAPARPPRIFEAAYYERLAAAEERHGWSRGMRRAMRSLLLPRLPARRPLRVLDAGCGTGLLLGELRQLAGAEPVGVDLALGALGFCRRRGAGRLAAARLPELPLRAGSFDLVLCIDTLQHLSPRGADREAMAALARLLVPGGLLYARTNAACGRRPLAGVDPDFYRRYRPADLRRLAEESGFEVLRLTYLDAIPSLAAMAREALAPDAAPAPAAGPPLELVPPTGSRAALGRVSDALHAIEALWLRLSGARLPFGHSLALVARRPQSEAGG